MKRMTTQEFKTKIEATVIAVVGILPTDTYIEVMDIDTGEIYAFTDMANAPQLYIPEWYKEEDVCFAPVINMIYKNSRNVRLEVSLDGYFRE